jgi:phenylpropionate dioxygenase-like ring-hydroxylating dioxygenase large terminal subunit
MKDAVIARDRFWHMLCHRSELPAPGDYLRMNWLNDEVVIANDNGEIVVFDNLCPHRGTRFFTDNSGNGAISCPYHGWAYRNGAMHIPCREKYASADLRNASIRMYQTDWCADFLFVGINPAMELTDQLGDTYDLLANISFDIHGRSDFNVGAFESDWRVALENALEPQHIDYVHPRSLGLLELADGENEFVAWTSVWRAAVTNTRAARQLKAVRSLFHVESQYEGYMSIYLFPFTMLSSTYGYSYSLQNFFPSTQANHTHFYSRLLNGVTKNDEARQALNNFFESTARINRQVFDEDQQICKLVSPTFVADNSRGILSADEEKIRHFRKCLGQLADFSEA